MMGRRVSKLRWSGVAAALVLAARTAGGAPAAEPTPADAHKAVTIAIHDLALTFKVSGKIEATPVKEGDRVEAGQVLMELSDQEGEVAIALYRRRADSNLAIQQAEAKLAQAESERKRLEFLLDKNASYQLEVERAQIAARIASLDLDEAKEKKEESRNELEAAVAKHDQFLLRAPIAGVIQTVTAEVGETAEQLKGVVRLVVTDVLRIETPVPTQQTLALKVGDPAWVRYDSPVLDRPLEGKIVFLAPAADATSQSRLVKVELPNREGFPPGMHVTVSFKSPAGASAAQPPAAPGQAAATADPSPAAKPAAPAGARS